MAGSVAAVVVASLLVLGALNRPYQSDIGGLRPVAMERTLALVEEARMDLELDDTARATPRDGPTKPGGPQIRSDVVVPAEPAHREPAPDRW